MHNGAPLSSSLPLEATPNNSLANFKSPPTPKDSPIVNPGGLIQIVALPILKLSCVVCKPISLCNAKVSLSVVRTLQLPAVGV